MSKIYGWKKIRDEYDGFLFSIAYKSEHGSLLEIYNLWNHRPSTSIAYSPFGGKTHIMYSDLSKSAALKRSREIMKTHK